MPNDTAMTMTKNCFMYIAFTGFELYVLTRQSWKQFFAVSENA
jgi:hypothetical protein